MTPHDSIQTETEREPVHWMWPFHAYRMPEPVEQICYYLGDKADAARLVTLQSVPYYIVNNSPNLIGAMDLAGEAMMIKASGTDLVSPQNRGKPLHYIIDPFHNLYKSVFHQAGVPRQPGDLMRPGYYLKAARGFGDLKAATIADSLGGKLPLVNRWQARATFASVLGMTVATLLPDDKDDAQEVEKNAELLHNSPLGYVGMRLGQAVYVPGWWHHKRQFAGLGKIAAGACTLLSGFRNVNTMTNAYFPNRAHSAAGLITAAAGAQLMLGLDDQQAWANFGKTMIWRTVLLPKSIMSRFQNFDKDAVYYLGAQTTFRVQDATAFLIGGAEKNPDGEIINKRAIRDQAREKAARGNAPDKGVSGIRHQGAGIGDRALGVRH